MADDGDVHSNPNPEIIHLRVGSQDHRGRSQQPLRNQIVVR